jgi:hypothetical protein
MSDSLELPVATASSAAPSLPELLFLLGFVAFAAVSWSAIVLAELGLFSGQRVLGMAACLTAVAGWTARREVRAAIASRARVSGWAWGSLAVTLAVAGFLYSRPGECLIDARDASVYVAIGRTIERTGGIASADPLLDVVGPDALVPLLTRDPAWPHLFNRFPGGIQVSDGSHRLVPNFFHLLPVWLATASAVAGPRSAYSVDAVFGVLSVLAVWLLGRRAWSPVAGSVAAALLAVNFGQVVYARLAFSEVLAQYLWLAGLCFTLLAHDRGSRLAGACAGAAIGLAGFARVDELCLLLPLTGAWLLSARRRGALGPAWGWYAATLALVGTHAVAHALLVSGAYSCRLAVTAWVDAVHGLGGTGPVAALGAAAAGVGGLIAAGRRQIARRLARPATRRLAALVGMALALALLAPATLGFTSRLVSVVGAVAALAGCGILLWRADLFRVFPVVAPFVAEAALLGLWRTSAALHADFRRLVPVILPMAALFIAVVVAEASTRPSRALRAAAWALPIGLISLWAWQAWPVLREPPMQGVHDQVALLARQIPAGAVVLSDRSAPSQLPLALQSAFARVTLPVMQRPSSASSLRAFVDRVLASGRPAYVMIAGYEGEVPLRLWRSDFVRFDVRRAGVIPLRYTALVPALRGMPRQLPTTSVNVELYEVTALTAGRSVGLPVVIDIGDVDFDAVLSGFYGREFMPSARARWTSGLARVALPRVASGLSPAALVLRAAAYRPAGIPAPTVRLSIDGTPVGTITGPGPGFAVYRVRLGEAAAARLRAGPTTLTLATDTFVPRAAGLGGDARELGVALDWIRLE